MPSYFNKHLFFFFFLVGISTSTIFGQLKDGYDEPSPLHLGPACQFSVINYCYGDTSYFLNQTLRVMNPRWEISDSTGLLFSSTDTNIKFLFPYPGTFSVSVSADNGHPDSLTKVLTIDSITKANFEFQQCSQQFINVSACADSFYWSFGDGNYSSAFSPSHFYADTGTYTVEVIAFSGSVSDTMSQTIVVSSLGFPTGVFTYYQSNDTVYFFGDTLAEDLNWDFGDQTSDTGLTPSHVFPDTGYYDVWCFASNYCDLKIYSQTVHVLAPSNVYDGHPGNKKLSLSAYPNPFSESTYLQIRDIVMRSQLRIIDAYGNLVIEMDLKRNDMIEIKRGNLLSGMYFAQLTSWDGRIYTAKLIIE